MVSRIKLSEEPSRIFLVGASGLLGQRIFNELRSKNDVLGTYFRHAPINLNNHISLDLTNTERVRDIFLDFKPHYLINCAGMTSVDNCENRPEAAIKLNAIVPHDLADLALNIDCRFIHISTDHFSSYVDAPRSESSQMIPVNQYGNSKLLGERLVLSKNPQSLIIRTNFFGLSDVKTDTLFQQAVHKLLTGEKIKGVTDIFFNPIGIKSLSDFICEQIKSKSQGIVNVAGPNIVSKYDFLTLICEALEMPSEYIKPVRSDELKFEASRPRYMALDTKILLKKFKFKTPELSQMIKVELKTLERGTLMSRISIYDTE